MRFRVPTPPVMMFDEVAATLSPAIVCSGVFSRWRRWTTANHTTCLSLPTSLSQSDATGLVLCYLFDVLQPSDAHYSHMGTAIKHPVPDCYLCNF